MALALLAALAANHAGTALLQVHGHINAAQFAVLIAFRESVTLGVVWFAASRFLRARAADLGLTRVRVRDVAIGVVAGVAFALTVTLTIARMYPTRDNVLFPALADGTLSSRLTMLLVVGVYSPFAQEVVFRGLLLTGLAQRMRAPLAVTAAAVVFGALHAASGPDWVVNAFAFGIVEGTLYVRLRSLWAPVAAHVATNSLGVGLYIAALQHAGR
jgi:membrane protease YdiL (CAAX protease family)